jgi:hypothetical protein
MFIRDLTRRMVLCVKNDQLNKGRYERAQYFKSF